MKFYVNVKEFNNWVLKLNTNNAKQINVHMYMAYFSKIKSQSNQYANKF